MNRSLNEAENRTVEERVKRLEREVERLRRRPKEVIYRQQRDEPGWLDDLDGCIGL